MDIFLGIAYFVPFAVSIGANILLGAVCYKLVKRVTAPPLNHFAEAAVEMMRKGQIDGGKEVLRGAAELMRANKPFAPNGPDEFFRIETDQSVTP